MSRLVMWVQGRRVPAARARGFPIAAALRARGISCAVRVPWPSVYGDMGLPWPLSHTREFFRPLAALMRLDHLRRLRRDDVVFFQRPATELPTAAIERWAARGRPSVFDFDDAIWVDFGGRRKVAALVAMADQVITGNAFLAEFAAAPARTTIIPTALDTARFRRLPTRDRAGRDVVVGWTGTRGNYRQLMTAWPGIEAALRRTGARFVAICNAPPPPAMRAVGTRYVRWSEASELDDLAAIDVGVMPLPDTAFARGKCAFKLLQYMALGRPGVASPVGANREVVTHGRDGFFAGTAADWEEMLVALIQDPSLRDRVGTAARARVEAAYSLDAVLPRYLEVLARVGLAPAGSAEIAGDVLGHGAAGEG